jgi:hypothetical protein
MTTNQMQRPPVHVVRIGQTVPHVPQLLLSVCLLTQPLPQQSGVLTPHTLPHEPQLFLSLVVSRHALPQHVGEPLVHVSKHEPQFALSLVVSAQ